LGLAVRAGIFVRVDPLEVEGRSTTGAETIAAVAAIGAR